MVTTITTIAAIGLTPAVGIAVGGVLMVFLATREVASASQSSISLRIAKFASVGAIPLIIIFATIVILEIATVI